ncbi:MAG TPA: Nramp family divalent metal transporter [Candidatus Bathyarchaeia archaeon]|nr:Nramp family divalent metal transporter [Candidatus Bathyarchaeia archaeon]
MRAPVEWQRSELPLPPPYTLHNVIRVIGPGAILLGLSLGSGDWILGPAATARWGPRILWICTLSVILQALLNTEMARYTLATGEPIFAGFMRLPPGPRIWGPAYALLHLGQVGWPGWALAAASALTAAFLGRQPRPDDQSVILGLGYAIFLGAVAVTVLGARARRTVEWIEWLLMSWTLLFLAALAYVFVPWGVWRAVGTGFVSPTLPADPDVRNWVLLAAFAAYSGAGGTINAALTQWLRDKGFGMGGTIEGRTVVLGGEVLRLARDGKTFEPTSANLEKWRQWWRYLRTDFWFLWTAGCLVSMALPALLAAQFAGSGEAWSGFGAPTWLAQAIGWRSGLVLWTLTLLTGFAILGLTQVGIVTGFVRSVTDILWTARARSRPPGHPVAAGGLYYAVLVAFAIAGCLAMTLADPFRLIVIGANVAALNFVALSLHTLWVNRVLLPPELRPSRWREIGVLACGVFFAALLVQILKDPARLRALFG